jgi:hypothetical protein
MVEGLPLCPILKEPCKASGCALWIKCIDGGECCIHAIGGWLSRIHKSSFPDEHTKGKA